MSSVVGGMYIKLLSNVEKTLSRLSCEEIMEILFNVVGNSYYA